MLCFVIFFIVLLIFLVCLGFYYKTLKLKNALKEEFKEFQEYLKFKEDILNKF